MEGHQIKVCLKDGMGTIELDGKPIKCRRAVIDTQGLGHPTMVTLEVYAHDFEIDIDGASVEFQAALLESDKVLLAKYAPPVGAPRLLPTAIVEPKDEV